MSTVTRTVKQVVPELKIRTAMVYAGGTISSLRTKDGYCEGGHVVDFASKIRDKAPSIVENHDIIGAEVAYTGLSENIDQDYWTNIARAVKNALETNPKTIIVTHGTDSMEQTARFLQKELGELLTQKGTQVILTGANKDLSDPSTDAWDNLGFAFDSARNAGKAGVYVAFHRKLIPAELVVKEPFNGTEMNYTALDDRKYLEAKWIQGKQADEITTKLRAKLDKPILQEGVIEYPVNIVRSNHQDFIDYVKQNNVKAVLLVLYHSGTANTENPDLSVAELVKDLRETNGVVFFGVTENGEPVDLHSYETSVKLREAGVVPLYNMNKAVALAKLQMVADGSPHQIMDSMLTNNVGEIDETRINSEDIGKSKKLYTQ